MNHLRAQWRKVAAGPSPRPGHRPEDEYYWRWKLSAPTYKTVAMNLTVAEMKELAVLIAATAAEHGDDW